METLTYTDPEELIFDFKERPLSMLPFHHEVDGLIRYAADQFPTHLAVHEIDSEEKNTNEYTEPHFHEEEDEINIIIPSKNRKLIYRIQLGEDIFLVRGYKSIWIPAGVVHAANVVRGSGYFVTIRMKKSLAQE